MPHAPRFSGRFPAASVWLGGLLFVLAGCSSRPVFECRFTEDPIVIDGKLDEAAWERAVQIDGFTMPGERGGPKPRKGTRAKLLWDRENLYVAADMEDTDIFADVTEHDGPTAENDVFEVFLKPDAKKTGYYEFHVTAANTVFDMFLPRRGKAGRFKKDVEFGIESAVAVRGTLDRWNDKDEGWSAEMRIPWESLMATGGRPNPGAEWLFALCRQDHDVERDGPELSSAAPLSRRDFHRHEDYAALRFLGPEPTSATRPYGIPKYVPVTTSRVVGSPDPPTPYVVERSRPAATINGPIAVAFQPGSDRILFVTEPGQYAPSKLMRMRDVPDVFDPETLLEADGSVHYDIAFHPQFAENGYVFVGSNGPVRQPEGATEKPACPNMTRITRYVIDREPPYTFHADSATVIIEWDSAGHNGGALAFGTDGLLYVTSGDGSSDSDADRTGQDLSRLRAKVLRIDVDHPGPDGRPYTVPADNPFVGMEGVRPETWAYGLRNPWRIAVDRETGRIWVGNNGQDLWEQVYLIEKGANYGWSVVEGSQPFAADQKAGPHPISAPTVEHPHSEARSLTGGIVYQGSALPELRGAYIYGDFSTGRIWGLRHDGQKVTWHELLADTTLQITAFAEDPQGELIVVDHHSGWGGGLYRLTKRPPPKEAVTGFPRRLSESGLFASVAEHRMAPGVVPYLVNSPLWSDGTHKARFFALPAQKAGGGKFVPTPISVTNARGWNFPDGTVLVKSFAIDERQGDPASRRWIETRFMLKEQGEWAGYSYEWNDDQTDALLVEAAGKDREFPVRLADGSESPQAWHYPSRTECMVCHSRAANYVLGLCTVQLNRDFDYAAVLGEGHAVDNQLRTLEHLGMLHVRWADAAHERLTHRAREKGLKDEEADRWVQRQTQCRGEHVTGTPYGSALLAVAPERTNRLVSPADATQDIAARARSYLQSNCASCHIFAGGGNGPMELEYLSAFGPPRPLDKMQALNVKPMHHTFGLPDARIIAGGHPERSVLLSRMSRRGPGQMPQLATAIVDATGVEAVREWIESLPPEETQVSAR